MSPPRLWGCHPRVGSGLEVPVGWVDEDPFFGEGTLCPAWGGAGCPPHPLAGTKGALPPQILPPPPLPGFTIIIEPFDDRTPTIANPILHFRCGHRKDTRGVSGRGQGQQGHWGGDKDVGDTGSVTSGVWCPPPQLHGCLHRHQTRLRALPVSHHHIRGKPPCPSCVPHVPHVSPTSLLPCPLCPPVSPVSPLPMSPSVPPTSASPPGPIGVTPSPRPLPADSLPAGHLPQNPGFLPRHHGDLHHDAGPDLPVPHGEWGGLGGGGAALGTLVSPVSPSLADRGSRQ